MSLRSTFALLKRLSASHLRFAPSNPLRWFSSLQLVGQEGLNVASLHFRAAKAPIGVPSQTPFGGSRPSNW